MKTLHYFALILMLGGASCGKDPKIDKVYNTVILDATASRFTGTLVQGVAATGATLTLAYSNGLGKTAQVFLSPADGLYSDTLNVMLTAATAADNGSGTLTLTLHGSPTKSGTVTLRPIVRVGDYEVFIRLNTNVTPSLVLDAAASIATGTFKINIPVTNGTLNVAYTSRIALNATVDSTATAGLYIPSGTLPLPASPDGGTFTLVVGGTPQLLGVQTLEVKLRAGTDSYSITVPVTVTGDITLFPDRSAVQGTIVKGIPADGTMIVIGYASTDTHEVTFSAESNNGLRAKPYTVTLPASDNGTVDVPLTGTPTLDGTMELKVVAVINEVGYSMVIPVNVLSDVPGEVFTPETITYKGLEYRTVFIDVNRNGYVDAGDVWLDRNIGATTADSGEYGADAINESSIGQRLQYGKPYGSTAFDASYTIDYAATGEWAICPEGYAVPTLSQFNAAIAAATGGTVSGNGVSGTMGITLRLLGSALRLPLCGWVTNGESTVQAYGTAACYWTSSEGSNTAPWKVDIHDNMATTTGSNWADAAWQIPVRCVKK